jgi:hypothetical protein
MLLEDSPPRELTESRPLYIETADPRTLERAQLKARNYLATCKHAFADII